MQIEVSGTELQNYIQKIKARVSTKEVVAVKYIALADQIVRVLCYTPEIVPHMEKQLPYVMIDSADKYDSTIVVWKEPDVNGMMAKLDPRWDPKVNMRLRLEMVYHRWTNAPSVALIDPEFSKTTPVVMLNTSLGFVKAFDVKERVYYYGVPDFSPEEFIKEGHVFVQQINRLIQNETTNIAHGAIIGFNNNGLLMCARGQRGKSTLTVHAMMHGFEYVADDYQILQNRGGEIYAWPIYSVITLSPKMYNELYDDLKGKFVSNNARKDKYVISIEPYHEQFRKAYPIRLCLFPEIVTDPEPSITFCTPEEKGRAIVQLIQSTVWQMQDLNHPHVIKKMFNMVKEMDFYKFNLSHNIDANTEYLRNFLKDFDFSHRKGIPTDKIMVDITFDLANILDTENYTFYSMNTLATSIYEALLAGVDKATIRSELSRISGKNKDILEEFDLLVETVERKGFLNQQANKPAKFKLNPEFAKECNFKISLLEYATNKTIELINLKKGT